MKKCFILILLFTLGCNENDGDASLLRPGGGVFTFGESTNLSAHFITKEIKVSDFFGEWTLTGSNFQYSDGTIDNLADFYFFAKEKQIMTINASEVKKPVFIFPTCFANGTHNKFTDSTITSFTWAPASGHPAKNVYINYTNNVLTLYYDSNLIIHNKSYRGNVFETYVKK